MKYLILITLYMAVQSTSAQNLANPTSLFNPAPFGFSHVAIVPEGKTLFFIAGQGGEKDIQGTLDPSFRDQVRQVLLNIAKALESQGLSLNEVVKVTTLVVDHDQDKLAIIVEEFEMAWPEGNFPVNTLIPVPKLALEGMQIEIDAVAVKQ
ncbi:RidA family protein [Algoriphagus sp. D3-2-R+10]|uniref:RidA family protein n=1 Tax=Algoriphagus aurantiacus TaxID=3103948 RepID=UPI002B3EE6F5|nr:RidA family protein [Algoriphagus sp. D3-2-R+10]MEB2775393.1 RidA family protein [Algoriphagus sp. D3-2-R+10]